VQWQASRGELTGLTNRRCFGLLLRDAATWRPSIGGVVVTPDRADPTELLREADVAMYAAKRAGGARMVIYDDASCRQTSCRWPSAIAALRDHGVSLALDDLASATTPCAGCSCRCGA
jgi:hypothetical protein